MCKRTFMRQSNHDKHMRNKHSAFPIHIFHVQEKTGAKQVIEPESCKSSAHPPSMNEKIETAPTPTLISSAFNELCASYR